MTIEDDIDGLEQSLSYVEGSAYVRYAAVLSETGVLGGWKTAQGVTPVYDADNDTFTFTTPDSVEGDFTAAGDQSLLKNAEGQVQAAYQLVYRTQIDTSVKYPAFGTTYQNAYTVSIDPSQESITEPSRTGRYTVTAGSAWGVGSKQGAFSVGKVITGTAASSIPADTEYTVRYEVVSPASHQRAGTFTVKAGETITSPLFDDGDTVRISEVLPDAGDGGETAEAVTWEAPRFTDAAGNEITEITFSSENGNLGGDAVVQLTLTNEVNQVPGSISWTKVDAEERDTVIAPAEWTITYPNGGEKTVVDNNSDGQTIDILRDADPRPGSLRIENLEWGHYAVTESVAPEGYQLEETPHEVTVNATALDVLASDAGADDGTIADVRIPVDTGSTAEPEGDAAAEDEGQTDAEPSPAGADGQVESDEDAEEQSVAATEASTADQSVQAEGAALAQTGASFEQLGVGIVLALIGAGAVVIARLRLIRH